MTGGKRLARALWIAGGLLFAWQLVFWTEPMAAFGVAERLAPNVGPLMTQSATPRLEPAECPFTREEWAASLNWECRWLVVPEVRGRDKSPDVRLFVAVLRARRAVANLPRVSLHGGPGESALVPMVRGVSQLGSLDRDMVIYDQRGAGLSKPDPCPEYAKRVDELDANNPVAGARRKGLQVVARECVANMRARGIDPAAYNTTENAADLIDLRRALGYERWDINGASYGARLALEAMRRDPRGIRSVAIENPPPPGAELAEVSRTTQQALERVFAACLRSSACHAAFPHPQEDFLAVFDALSCAPVSSPGVDTAQRLVLDAKGFVVATRSVLRSRDAIAALPMLVHELRSGDRLRAARELLRLGKSSAGRPGRATFWLVNCYDQYGSAYEARVKSVRGTVWPAMARLPASLEDCPLWLERFARPEEHAPVVSSIPTLILTGEFDPRTPVEFGRVIGATLSHAYLFEMPGETHGGRPRGCRATILSAFSLNPEAKPDASCIAAMPSVEFLTKWAP